MGPIPLPLPITIGRDFLKKISQKTKYLQHPEPSYKQYRRKNDAFWNSPFFQDSLDHLFPAP